MEILKIMHLICLYVPGMSRIQLASILDSISSLNTHYVFMFYGDFP